ncbi:MAG: YceI family protein [Marinifilaceae bacterium]|jgi:polyisoprenoid-binding protein YceI|nr:YceI family protein [Marinifilaceae bacterium]
MKKLFLLSVFVLLFSSIGIRAQQIDINKSKVSWIGKKVTGEHSGTINLKSAAIQIKDEQIKSGEFVIDMNSMICTDIKDAAYNKKLIGHLKSDDFFGVVKYSTAKLVIRGAELVKNKYVIQADLTIKGKTERIEFNAVKTSSGFIALLEIDRTKFNIRYGSGKFFENLGNKMISDIFTLNIELVLKA